MAAVKDPLAAFGGLYPIGVDNQRIATMGVWAERGANFLVRADETGASNGIADFLAVAKSKGFRAIVPHARAAAVPAGYWGGTAVGVNLDDEPDLEGHQYGIRPAAGWPLSADTGKPLQVWDTVDLGGGRVADMVGRFYRAVKGGPATVPTGATPAVSAEVYAYRAAAARKVMPPDVPVFGSFAGQLIDPAAPGTVYADYARSLDWVCQDWYPINRDPTPPGQPRRYQLSWPGSRSMALSRWSGGKPAFSIIEAGWTREDRNGRWPTPAEFMAEVWGAIVQGVKGIIYFPQKIGGGYRPDAITACLTDDGWAYPAEEKNAAAALADAIAGTNRRITTLSPYLTSGTWAPAVTLAEGVYMASWVIPGAQLTVRVNTNPITAGGMAAYAVDVAEVRATDPLAEVRKLAEDATRAAGDAAKVGLAAGRAALAGTADALQAAAAALRKMAEGL